MPLTLDFSNAEAQRLRITQEQQKHIEELYKQASKRIGELAEQAPRVPSDVIRQQYLRDLQQQINDALRSIQGDLGSTIREHSQQVAAETVKDAKEFLHEVGLPIGGAYSNVPIEIVQAVASGQLYTGNWTLSRALWLNTMETQKDVQSIVAQGILQNRSAYDIAKDLEKYVDPSARKDWEWSKVYPGTRKVVDYNAQRLARTMVSHAYQQAFVRTTIKNPFITKYQWQAANGEHVCEICMERDGKLFDKDDLPLDHPNGMCTYLAVIEDSMEDIADRLADWAHGDADTELDEWAKDLYGNDWQEKEKESSDSLMQRSMDLEFKQIDAALERFLHSDGSKSLDEMFPDLDLNAGRIEKDSVKNLIEYYIKPFNDDLKAYGDGFLYWDPDQTVSILYKGGKIINVSLDWWDESKRIPVSGIDSIIVDGGWGTAVGGKNIRLYNTREEWEYGKYGYKSVRSRYEDFNDIRADFK